MYRVKHKVLLITCFVAGLLVALGAVFWLCPNIFDAACGRDSRVVGESPPTEVPAIIEAIERNDCKAVRQALAAGADPSTRLDGGLTPLHVAAQYGYCEIAVALIDAGASVDARDTIGQTPLFLAVIRDQLYLLDTKDKPEMVQLLLDHGATVDARDNAGDTPLTHVANTPSISSAIILLEHGANPNSQNKQGWTPLFWAVESYDKPMIELFLAHGADTKVVDQNGKTVFDRTSDKEVIEMLRRVSTQPSSSQSAPSRKVLSLDDFKLTAGLTEVELRAKVGDPDHIGGSGLPWLVYRLKTGEELWISFDPYDPHRKLRAANLYSADHMERKRLFGGW